MGNEDEIIRIINEKINPETENKKASKITEEFLENSCKEFCGIMNESFENLIKNVEYRGYIEEKIKFEKEKIKKEEQKENMPVENKKTTMQNKKVKESDEMDEENIYLLCDDEVFISKRITLFY